MLRSYLVELLDCLVDFNGDAICLLHLRLEVKQELAKQVADGRVNFFFISTVGGVVC